MFALWIAAAALSAAAGWLMLSGARDAARRVVAGDPAVAVHRRQLQEIEHLAARGLLPASEVKAARAEAGRRLLAAADRPAATGKGDSRRLVLGIVVAAPIAALAIFLGAGGPVMPDQPFAARLKAWREGDPARLDPPRMAAVLSAISRDRPNDPEAFRHLALAKLASGDAPGATAALRRAVAIAPQRADLWAALGEAFVIEAEGKVDRDARLAFGEAIKRDPKSLSARYFLGRADIQDGDAADGLRQWRALLADLGPQDAGRADLLSEIAVVERTGRLPEASEAPVQPDDAAIRGMVEGLAARLEAEPNDPEGWVRLVRAWTVLGEAEKRDAALRRAQDLFRNDPETLRALERAIEAPK